MGWKVTELLAVAPELSGCPVTVPVPDPGTGPGTGPGLELLTAVMRHYRQITGRQLSAGRVMAWHFRNALYDVLWRSEAGISLADHRTPPEWVDDLAGRFSALGIDPDKPHPGGHVGTSAR